MQPDGTYYLGPGATSAYGIVNIGVHYQLTKWLQVLAQVNNLFDTRYYTGAQLQGTGFTSTGNVHREAAAGDRRRIPGRTGGVLLPGRADDVLDRHPDEVLSLPTAHTARASGETASHSPRRRS